MTDDFRVCVLAEPTIASWQRTALKRTVAQTNATVECVVVNDEAGASTTELLRRAVELREWSLVSGALAVEKRIVGGIPESDPHGLDEVPAIDGATLIECEPEIVEGWKYRIPDSVVKRVGAEADVGLLFGFGFITGAILDAFEHGVLSFHHGDLREYRGMPMGFWEYVAGEDEVGVTLQRLNETLDGGEIIRLRRVGIGDLNRWKGVKSRLLASSDSVLVEGVRRVQDDSFEPERPDELGELKTTPRGRPVGRFVVKTLAGALSNRLGRADGESEA